MENLPQTIGTKEVEARVIELRGQKIILDRDAAELYQTETREINKAVKNNPERILLYPSTIRETVCGGKFPPHGNLSTRSNKQRRANQTNNQYIIGIYGIFLAYSEYCKHSIAKHLSNDR